MVNTTYSIHAETRSQQRGIPRWIHDLLVEHGERRAAPGGLLKVYFSARSRRRILALARGGALPVGKLDHAWGSYLVMTRGAPHVVTVGHLGAHRLRRG